MSANQVCGTGAESAHLSETSSQRMQAICDRVVRHLERVDFQRAYALLPAVEFLECGVRFVLTETGLRGELMRSAFSEQDILRAQALKTTLLSAPLPRDPLEQLHALLQRCSVALMQHGQPTALNTFLLTLLHRMRQPLRRQLPWARRRDEACELLVSVLL